MQIHLRILTWFNITDSNALNWLQPHLSSVILINYLEEGCNELTLILKEDKSGLTRAIHSKWVGLENARVGDVGTSHIHRAAVKPWTRYGDQVRCVVWYRRCMGHARAGVGMTWAMHTPEMTTNLHLFLILAMILYILNIQYRPEIVNVPCAKLLSVMAWAK